MTTVAEADRTALRAAVRELLDDQSSESRVRDVIAEDGGFDGQLWTRLLDMGVIELAATEHRTAAGASFLDLVILFEELGRTLAPVPALSAATALSALDRSSPQLSTWADDLISGRRRASVALEVDGELRPAPSLQAQLSEGGVRVSGTVKAAPDVIGADALLVFAATDAGPGLFLVPADSVGVTITPVAALDLTRPSADVEFAAVPALTVAGPGQPRIARVLQVLWLLQAAEQLGVAQRALDEAVNYAKIRHQFGRSIGSFQAIKHACVDMLIRVEGARGLVSVAATALDDDNDPALHVSLAAAYAGEAAIECAERGLQIHGGIGYTWEHISHLLLRKARSGSVRVGTAAAHWQAVTRGLASRAESELD